MALYAFDGTWNDSSAPAHLRDIKKDTNVHRFRVLYNEKAEYKDGIGSRYGLVGKYLGGVTGAGAERRVSEHFEALKKNFEKGDTRIDVIGYSRGAAIARMFVHRIDRDFDQLLREGKALTKPPTVHFLGLFDTVASFGLPWTENEHDFEATIPGFVERTFHAMALDETRETFGIERCVGDRSRITEVWFRGGHGDIGGNATYVDRKGEEQSNRARSDIALDWMIAKARDAGVPVRERESSPTGEQAIEKAPVTALDEVIRIGDAGTLSRRIHVGDLVHHSVEESELTRGIDGRLLRRIEVLTRIEDRDLESRADAVAWNPPPGAERLPDNVKPIADAPSIVQLSLRRYPFDVLPARTWDAWVKRWKLTDRDVSKGRGGEFWAPTDADRAFAWQIYVELTTRIASRELHDDEGVDITALESIRDLFGHMREGLKENGVGSANAGALVVAFLNEKVRAFTSYWHQRSEDEGWKEDKRTIHPEFRQALRELQPTLRELADALSHLADARLLAPAETERH